MKKPKLITFLFPALAILMLLGVVGNVKAFTTEAEVEDIIGVRQQVMVDGTMVTPESYDELMYFHGKVKKVKDCAVHFKATDGNTYIIPGDDIFAYRLKDEESKFEDAMFEIVTNGDECAKGTYDADNYHGKYAGNFAGGFLLGVFWIIGAAIADPTPYKGKDTMLMSQNQHLFTNPVYLQCYKKKAKAKNVGAATAGWATWILIVLLASSGG